MNDAIQAIAQQHLVPIAIDMRTRSIVYVPSIRAVMTGEMPNRTSASPLTARRVDFRRGDTSANFMITGSVWKELVIQAHLTEMAHRLRNMAPDRSGWPVVCPLFNIRADVSPDHPASLHSALTAHFQRLLGHLDPQDEVKHLFGEDVLKAGIESAIGVIGPGQKPEQHLKSKVIIGLTSKLKPIVAYSSEDFVARALVGTHLPIEATYRHDGFLAHASMDHPISREISKRSRHPSSASAWLGEDLCLGWNSGVHMLDAASARAIKMRWILEHPDLFASRLPTDEALVAWATSNAYPKAPATRLKSYLDGEGLHFTAPPSGGCFPVQMRFGSEPEFDMARLRRDCGAHWSEAEAEADRMQGIIDHLMGFGPEVPMLEDREPAGQPLIVTTTEGPLQADSFIL